MSYFKDLVKNDRATFINIDEFGEEHDIDGVKLKIVLENEQVIEKDDVQALSESAMILFAYTEDIGYRRMQGESLHIDGVTYTVQTWLEEMGITKVTLSIPEVW